MDEIAEKLKDADPFASWWPFIIAGVVFLATTVKAYMNGQYCPSGNLITDQVVVVTGGDGGIGSEIVKELAKRAAIVVMCCRDVQNGEKVKAKIQKFLGKTKIRIDIRQLDLNTFDNIKEFVKNFGTVSTI
jgi:FlaA1/EpsC-like NDP-sugar epimerase